MDLVKRKRQRLKQYNYSKNAAYFITMCTQNKKCLFGNINNGKLVLNNAGFMIHEKIKEIPENYLNICVDKYVVMPNHVHLIITLNNTKVTDNGMTPVSFRFESQKISI